MAPAGPATVTDAAATVTDAAATVTDADPPAAGAASAPEGTVASRVVSDTTVDDGRVGDGAAGGGVVGPAGAGTGDAAPAGAEEPGAAGAAAATEPTTGAGTDAGLQVGTEVAAPVRVGWHLAPEGRTAAGVVAPLAGGALVFTGATYLGWRAGHLGGTGVTGVICFVAELALYLVLTALAVCAGRVNRGFVRRPPSPAGTLDVFVVLRDEPLGDLDRTLRSAHGITYPHRVYLLADTRVADGGAGDGPAGGRRDAGRRDAGVGLGGPGRGTAGGRGGWRSVEALTRKLDVTCLIRSDGPPSRPGLLNAALARTDGDAILLLDAGDVVTPDAAHQLLGYLRDPQVGLVAGAWRAGPAGQGPLPDRPVPRLAQLVAAARDRDGAVGGAGGGTLYRRVALETVDGFSERGGTEEPGTSYQLHTAGWASVQHPDVIMVRAARSTATAARLTVLRAVDRLRILLFDNPLARRGLTGWQRAHHLADAALPLLAALQAGVWLGPALVVLGGGRLATGTDAGEWCGFGLPYLAAAVVFGLTVTGLGGHGPAAALTGWLVSIPLSVLALARVTIVGGRGRLDAAPDVTPSALVENPLPIVAPSSAPPPPVV
ncbi:glycosyltransferase, partial [Frankia sp. CNm7]